MKECIFCKIVRKEVKSEIVYEDNNFLVFKDINPKAPIHLLLIPKIHISSLNDVDDENSIFLNGIFKIIKNIAYKLNFYESGYRVVINTGPDSGQEVKHLHLHILAKRIFNWPPG